MRLKTFLVPAVAALALSGWHAPPASAQSIFKSLFGFATPKKKARAPMTRRPRTQLYRSQNPRSRTTLFGPRRGYAPRSNRRGYVYGGYKTICVRTCDGYYFPISAATTRSRFHTDARDCSRRCGGGQLFYMPRRSQNMARARNLSGRAYADLENAFKYRKSLVNGCACKPMPWSSTERSRHLRYEYIKAVQDSYKLAEARAKARAEKIAKQAQKRAADARAADARAAILTAKQELDTPAAKTGEAGAFKKFTNIALNNSPDFLVVWQEISQKYAAPYYAIGRRPIRIANLEPGHADTKHIDRDDDQPPVTTLAMLTGRQRETSAFGDLDLNRHSEKPQPATGPRKTRVARAKKRARRKKPKTAFSGFFGQQKSSYRWPGD